MVLPAGDEIAHGAGPQRRPVQNEGGRLQDGRLPGPVRPDQDGEACSQLHLQGEVGAQIA